MKSISCKFYVCNIFSTESLLVPLFLDVIGDVNLTTQV